jgi:hypothetical protein
VKCACRTCVVRDRESLPTQPLCEPVNDGVICAAGDLSGISAGEPTWGGAYLMSAHPSGHAVSCMCKPFSWAVAHRKRHGQKCARS